MATKTVRAMSFEQDGHTLLVTALSAKDLLDFTTVDHYDSRLDSSDPKQGYQRPEEKARAKKVGRYLIGTTSPLLPTTILLNSRSNNLSYDTQSQLLTLDDEAKLQIVDGQHRVAGLRYAIYDAKNTALLDFKIPVVVILGLDKISEMEQFRIVNGTQKSVRTDLVNMILSQIMASRGEDSIPDRDVWKIVVSKVTERLNDDCNSVWHNIIVMPDESAYGKKDILANPSLAEQKLVRATSFMQSLQRLYRYLVEYNHIPSSRSVDDQAETLAELLNEYWSAIATICPEPFETPSQYVIQKTPGVFALHMVAIPLVKVMYLAHRPLKKDQFEVMLSPGSEVFSEGFWRSKGGRAADFGSMKGFTELAEIIAAEVGLEL